MSNEEYEQKLKEWHEWHEYMDGIKPRKEDYGFQSSSLEQEGGWMIEEGESAYGKALSEWQMKRSCDAPNPPGYTRANND